MSVALNLNPDAPAAIDFMVPGKGEISLAGNWARRLLQNELDVNCMRPYEGPDGRVYITKNFIGNDGAVHKRAVPTNNSDATLRFLDWIDLDNAVIKAAKPRLKAAADLEKNGLVYRLANGIAKSTMQYQEQSDISGAIISMDGLRQSESDRPVFNLIQFPIPLIHKDFSYPLRQILESRTGFSPLDTTTAELAARRVSEQVEQLVLGCGVNSNFTAPGQLLGASSYKWNANTIYGYMNYPSRIAFSLHLPTVAGWVPQNTVDDILQMKKASQTAFHFGPWKLYCGLYWDPYMDEDYKPTYNDTTLRQRLAMINGISEVETVDYIPDQSLILVQQTTDVVRLVKGMDITTVQWESHGGLQLNFKVMCCIVPQLRSDYYGNTGIVHGS